MQKKMYEYTIKEFRGIGIKNMINEMAQKGWKLVSVNAGQYYFERLLTQRALDGAKAPRKSKRSTDSPRK